MKSRFLLLSVMSMFLIFTSCKKDSSTSADANETMNNSVSANTWTVTSWTNNGVESMQTAWNSVIMTYKKEDKNNGSFSWAIIDMSGGTANMTGKYTIQNNGKEINLDGDIANISISGGNLTIDGNIQGTAMIIKAKK